MELIRSSNQKPPPPPAPVDDEYADDDSFGVWWEPPELMRAEDRLPKAEGSWTYFEDEYEHMAWVHRVSWDVDDRPTWAHAALVTCSRCGEPEDLDPLGTCWGCRVRDRRCQWCGLDRLVYTTEGACRTCYQRLRRTSVTSEESLRISLMEAAFRRSDLRKRRQRVR